MARCYGGRDLDVTARAAWAGGLIDSEHLGLAGLQERQTIRGAGTRGPVEQALGFKLTSAIGSCTEVPRKTEVTLTNKLNIN
jgi:hypothetical protein